MTDAKLGVIVDFQLKFIRNDQIVFLVGWACNESSLEMQAF